MRMILFLKNKKNILLKRFTYIFLLIYTLSAPKINDLYMTKKISIKRKIKETTIIKEHLYLFFLNERGRCGQKLEFLYWTLSPIC